MVKKILRLCKRTIATAMVVLMVMGLIPITMTNNALADGNTFDITFEFIGGSVIGAVYGEEKLPIYSGTPVTDIDEYEYFAFTFTAPIGHHPYSIRIDGGSCIIGQLPPNQREFSTSFEVTDNHIVEIEYALNTYDITVNFTGFGTMQGGAVTQDDDSPPVNNINNGFTFPNIDGDRYFAFRAQVTNANSHHIESIIISGYNNGQNILDQSRNANTPDYYEYNFKITTNHVITVVFALNAYTVRVDYNESGGVISSNNVTITPGNNVSVVHDGSLELKIEPKIAEGYLINSIYVDGSNTSIDLTGDTDPEFVIGSTYATYTFSDVEDDHTIDVSFANPGSTGEENSYFAFTQGDIVRVVEDDDTRVFILNRTGNITFSPVGVGYRIMLITSDGTVLGDFNSESINIDENTQINAVLVSQEFWNTGDSNFIQLVKPISIIVDVTAPIVTPPTETFWIGANQSVQIPTRVTDEESGVRTVRYSTDIDDFLNCAFENQLGTVINRATGNYLDGIYIFTASARAACQETVYHIWSYDEAQNKSLRQTVTVITDAAPPIITGFSFAPAGDTVIGNIINFLTFGIFFNNNIEVTVSAEDFGSFPSGLRKITLYIDDEVFAYEKVTGISNSATFALGLEDDIIRQSITATATDMAGNTSPVRVGPSEFRGDLNNDLLTLEDTPPTIMISVPSDGVHVDANWHMWFVDNDVDFAVEVRDADSGISSVEIHINGVLVFEKQKTENLTRSFYELNIRNLINNTQAVRDENDGSYVIVVTAVDNAGNSHTDTQVFFVDLNPPVIAEFVFISDYFVEAYGTDLRAEASYFGFYFMEDTDVRIYARDDGGPSSGIRSITYYTIDVNGTRSANTTVDVDENNSITTTIPADFKGQIFARATDNVGRGPGEVEFMTPSSVIVESPSMHATEQHIFFSRPDAPFTDVNGLDLYAGSVNVDVRIADTFSGLRNVEWAVTAPQDTGNNQSGSFAISNLGNSVGDSIYGWSIDEMDNNLVTGMSRTITVNNDSNTIVLWVKITDRTGNTSENRMSFSIDRTNPTIEVTYDNENSDAEFTDYFDADRIATIVITERNFNPQNVEISIVNEIPGGRVPEVSSWLSSIDAGNPDNSRHSATITYSDDGDFIFNISFRDNANNPAAAFEEHRFTIDKTLPVIEVEFDLNTDVANDGSFHFNEDRTATITVIERNFEPSRFEFDFVVSRDGQQLHASQESYVEAFANQYYTISAWTSAGDVHTRTVLFNNEDAYYRFNVSKTDRAGNIVEVREADEFIVDKIISSAVIREVEDRAAYAGHIAPVIEYSDTNFDPSGVRIVLTGANRGVVAQWQCPENANAPSLDTIGTFENIHNGQIFTFDNFETTREWDDVYILEVAFSDFAGNVSESASVMFSVNRYGSNFVVYCAEIRNLIENLIWTNQPIGRVAIKEINVSGHGGQAEIKMNLDGGAFRDLVLGEDYSIVQGAFFAPDSEDDISAVSNAWSAYTYILNAELFTDVAMYVVQLISEDEAGNISMNFDYNINPNFDILDSPIPNGTIEFGFDNVPPAISFVNLDVDGANRFNAPEMDVVITIVDRELVSYRVFLNDVDVTDDVLVQGNEYTLNIPASTSMHSVRVTAIDAAGNLADSAVNDILITTNAFVLWFHNTPLFVGTLIGATLLLGAFITGVFLIRRKKFPEPEATASTKKS